MLRDLLLQENRALVITLGIGLLVLLVLLAGLVRSIRSRDRARVVKRAELLAHRQEILGGAVGARTVADVENYLTALESRLQVDERKLAELEGSRARRSEHTVRLIAIKARQDDLKQRLAEFDGQDIASLLAQCNTARGEITHALIGLTTYDEKAVEQVSSELSEFMAKSMQRYEELDKLADRLEAMIKPMTQLQSDLESLRDDDDGLTDLIRQCMEARDEIVSVLDTLNDGSGDYDGDLDDQVKVITDSDGSLKEKTEGVFVKVVALRNFVQGKGNGVATPEQPASN